MDRKKENRVKDTSLDGGFIILARSIHSSPVMDMPPHFREIWLYLLRRAHYKETIVGRKVLQRGQCLINYKETLRDLSWFQGFKRFEYTESQFKNAITALTREGMITRQKTARGAIITIVNYDKYQNPENYKIEGMPYFDENMEMGVGNSCEDGQDGETERNQGQAQPEEGKKSSQTGAPAKNNRSKVEIKPEHEQLASDYLRKHMEIYPNLTKSIEKSKISSGAAAVERLVRTHGYEIDFIREVVFWAVQDDFWGRNLCSLGSLVSISKNKEIKFKNIVSAWESKKRRSAPKQAQYKQGKDYGDSDVGFLGGDK